jgi:flagellar biosynthesis protein FlhF
VDGELASELRELLAVVREMVDGNWRREDGAADPELGRLHRALLAQGVDGVLAAMLVRATAERLAADRGIDTALADVLGAATSAPRRARVRMLVGPPGDGKTTTLAKLAARERAAGRRVVLVTTDTYRVGSVAELETYGRALGAPVVVAPGARALAHALGDAAGAERVFVDTAGAGPGQTEQVAELVALAEAAGADAERMLVVGAATGARGAEEVWRTFAPLAPAACVLTKVDIAPGAAPLAVLWRSGVPVSHVSAGRRIPDDLEAATPARLARALLAA